MLNARQRDRLGDIEADRQIKLAASTTARRGQRYADTLQVSTRTVTTARSASQSGPNKCSQPAQTLGGGSTRVRRRGIERGKLLMGSCVVCMVRTHNKRHATHAVKKAPMRPRKIPLSGRRRPASPRIRPEERSYVGLFVAHTWSAGWTVVPVASRQPHNWTAVFVVLSKSCKQRRFEWSAKPGGTVLGQKTAAAQPTAHSMSNEHGRRPL